MVVLKFWNPRRSCDSRWTPGSMRTSPRGELLMAGLPYMLLVVFVLVLGSRRKGRSRAWTRRLMPDFLPRSATV